VKVSSPDSIPEITLRALILGGLLTMVMLAANIYLGLRVGMTVSASVPAAVISMAILRGILRRGTVLENNIVQTMASAGESLAAGIIFTVPALVLVGVWQDFQFWPTTLIAMLGGLLGVLFMVPLRRALIVERPDLTYPEGVACAQVLTAGEEGGRSVRLIGLGLLAGALVKGLVTGVHLVRGTLEGAVAAGRSVFYFGADISPALLAVGYIVNLHIAALVFMGGAFGWLVLIPLLAPDAAANPLDNAWALWSTQVRYVGVGAMLVGGLHALWSVRHGIVHGIQGLRGFAVDSGVVERTEQDLPLRVLAPMLALTALGVFALYFALIGHLGVALVAALMMLIASFIFVAVATYICGLVGTSNSPVSGMTICALLMTAVVFLLLGITGDSAILATLGVAGVVCCATATAGDVAQDLKTGSLVGATPWKQQAVEVGAVILPAFIIAPILTLLHEAYTIGSSDLLAPQAMLFASLARGFFGDGELPWDMVAIGAGVGVGLLVLNAALRMARIPWQAHVMPVAVGIYLPFALAVPIFLGGLLRHFLGSRDQNNAPAEARDPGILFGSGLIAGESLMGIAIAIPIALKVTMPHLGEGAIITAVVGGALVAMYAVIARRA
jgi:putative OPT family oligopeptide transporter